MTDEHQQPAVRPSPYTRPLDVIHTFTAWRTRWDAIQTEEEAMGLLHVLPDHFWENGKPVGVRFLLELVEANLERSCRSCSWSCKHEQLRDKARDVLAHRFLKESENRRDHEAPPWLGALCSDPALFPLLLKILGHISIRINFEKFRETFVARCFHAHNYGPQEWRVDFVVLVRAHLVSLLTLTHKDFVRVSDGTPEMEAALRELAFQPDSQGVRPRNLDEACITTSNHFYACKLLVIEARKRATERQEQEKSRQYKRDRLKNLGDDLARMLAESDKHAPAAIKALQDEISELTHAIESAPAAIAA